MEIELRPYNNAPHISFLRVSMKEDYLYMTYRLLIDDLLKFICLELEAVLFESRSR